MKRLSTVKLILCFVTLGLCMLACNSSIGLIERNGKRYSEASFLSLTETTTRQIEVQEGMTALMMAYDLEVQSGTLTVKLSDPRNAVVWEKTFEAPTSESDCISIEAPSAGKWALEIAARKAGGRYRLEWGDSCPAGE